MATPTPELGRSPKAGLQHRLEHRNEARLGTPAPGAGYALTLTERSLATRSFAHDHDRSDVATGIALVAMKRASVVGRGPTVEDVLVALAHFGLRDAPVIDRALTRPFAGLAGNYATQRRFVDAVDEGQLVSVARTGAPELT